MTITEFGPSTPALHESLYGCMHQSMQTPWVILLYEEQKSLYRRCLPLTRAINIIFPNLQVTDSQI
jgi:hypothetical protein